MLPLRIWSWLGLPDDWEVAQMLHGTGAGTRSDNGHFFQDPGRVSISTGCGDLADMSRCWSLSLDGDTGRQQVVQRGYGATPEAQGPLRALA